MELCCEGHAGRDLGLGYVQLHFTYGHTSSCAHGAQTDYIGQMDGSGFNMGGQGWHHPRHTVEEPTPVPLPCRAEAVSVGRNHMLVLDQDNLIWELRSWGRVSTFALTYLGMSRSCTGISPHRSNPHVAYQPRQYQTPTPHHTGLGWLVAFCLPHLLWPRHRLVPLFQRVPGLAHL